MNFISKTFGKPMPSVNATELNKKLSSGEKLMLLDVREPEEFVEGHIAGATLIPLGELQERANELPENEPIICICAHGNRSVMATQYLMGAGFNAINMNKGMMGWITANLPTIKGME